MFDIKGNIAHFRRPDTTGTHATYPFITRTSLHGLIASVLGLEQLTGTNMIGIQLLAPICTRVQEMSMLGKGWLGESKSTFNRPTSIELVINPNYRIYYTGDHLEKLSDMLQHGRSHYHTYLGSAYCLTFPRYVECVEVETIVPQQDCALTCSTVVPSHVISSLMPAAGCQYGRVGGMHYQYLGERRFKGTINLIYETAGKTIVIKPKVSSTERPVTFCMLPGKEVVCIW
ncbi:CRISPR-associated protein Cas5 [Peptococcaceae bacterium 1198_IL3148]